MLLGIVRREDLRSLEIFGQRRTQVGILKGTQVLRFGRIRGADLSRLHRKVSLSQATARKEFLIYHEQKMAASAAITR